MYDPVKQQRRRILAAAAVWEEQAAQRRTDAAIGNLLRAIAQFPPQREPTAYERRVIDATLELADAVDEPQPDSTPQSHRHSADSASPWSVAAPVNPA